MGVVTISISDETEKLLRRRARQVLGKKKGVLSKAVEDAIVLWAKSHDHIERCLELLEEGIDMGGVTYRKREELHDRN